MITTRCPICCGHLLACVIRLASSRQKLQNRHRLSVMSKMYRWWSTVIGSNAQRNYQLKQLEERVKRRQVQCCLLNLTCRPCRFVAYCRARETEGRTTSLFGWHRGIVSLWFLVKHAWYCRNPRLSVGAFSTPVVPPFSYRTVPVLDERSLTSPFFGSSGFASWRAVCAAGLDLKPHQQLFDLTRDVFRELKDQTIGPSSSRYFVKDIGSSTSTQTCISSQDYVPPAESECAFE